MSTSEPINISHHRQTNSKRGDGSGEVQVISFNRLELNQILRIYGFQVANGEWRDYAIDMLRDRAVFSIFRHSSEIPLYRIEKKPSLARRQGAFAVVAASGHILKRGQDLATVLRILQPKPKIARF